MSTGLVSEWEGLGRPIRWHDAIEKIHTPKKVLYETLSKLQVLTMFFFDVNASDNLFQSRTWIWKVISVGGVELGHGRRAMNARISQ